MRLRKRNGIWHARYWDHGERVERSTKQTDKKAAEAEARKFEREAADPDYARSRSATLNDAFALLHADRAEQARAKRKSEATVSFYRQKSGHWVRILGHGFLLEKLTSREVTRYISTRRGEARDKAGKKPISDHTIGKELVALRAALKLAVHDRIWRGDPKAIVPVSFSPDYKPRDRWLPPDEFDRLLGALDPHEAARVAFMVAVSAEWSATDRAERADAASESVHVRGTKRATRNRWVPVVTDWQRTLVAYALKHAGTRGRVLFKPWPGVHQSLAWACERAGIEYCTPNDLRRTFAQWMRRDGMPIELVAPMMGHADTKMLQRVYGRLDPATLAARARAALCPTSAPPRSETDVELEGIADDTKMRSVRENKGQQVVGRPGLEPGTNGLKVRAESAWTEPGKTAPKRQREVVAKTVFAPPVPHPTTTSTAKRAAREA